MRSAEPKHQLLGGEVSSILGGVRRPVEHCLSRKPNGQRTTEHNAEPDPHVERCVGSLSAFEFREARTRAADSPSNLGLRQPPATPRLTRILAKRSG
jgi:hypothetical protein